MSNKKPYLVNVLEKDIIIDAQDEGQLFPCGMLMHLYSYNEYNSERDVLNDGGTPKKIRV